ENAGLYLAEKNEIAHRILENQENFLRDLERLLLKDTMNLLRLVDKKHFLEKEDNPKDIIPLKPNNAYLLNRNDLSLRDFVEDALRKMSFAAKDEGITIVASSTYRSYEYQEGLYERNVKELGQEAADRESARPGTSQHQLGTVVDFGSITDEFALTKAGIWLDNNASRFGFSLSFPQGYEEVTGYRWESWHYRYIGLDACLFQEAYFNNIQQYMLEFIHLWKNLD
ncbi:MAG TPA: M15 family metallopeptidase, partial [Treponemataceae bacterium]|nr:M15 family metallopeptidase [Treponemataceae bacterium]